MAPAHRTVDSNKNDTKTERKCGLRGREPCYVILISWRKSVGTRHIFSLVDHRFKLIIMRETVFKVQSDSDKVLCSRNAPRSCIHCLVESKTGSPDFPVCSGCRGVRYCVRPELILRPRLTKKTESRTPSCRLAFA